MISGMREKDQHETLEVDLHNIKTDERKLVSISAELLVNIDQAVDHWHIFHPGFDSAIKEEKLKLKLIILQGEKEGIALDPKEREELNRAFSLELPPLPDKVEMDRRRKICFLKSLFQELGLEGGITVVKKAKKGKRNYSVFRS
jgi:hypothetical protein